MNNAIELEQVTKKFGRQIAVNQLELAVPRGAIYGFIGPNGSGKTTTLRMILRIFQPDQGRVTVLGKSSGKTADNRLGYLPEERGLYKRMRVKDILTYYARLKGVRDCRQDLDHWLQKLGASQWANKKIDMLSKGMAQKIQFIAAVIAKPELVILDEPFSGLDPVNLESIKEAVFQLRENGTTIVFSTHDMDMAEKMCDTIFMIFQGKKVLDGSLTSIQSQFPANRLRVQFSGDTSMPRLPGIQDVQSAGRFHELDVQPDQDTQALLQQLANQRVVTHFEILKPSLHDIFVQIASPNQNGNG